MTRFACVFLPYWPIERHIRERRKNAPEQKPGKKLLSPPFALVASEAGGWRLTALNARAEQLGLLPGDLLADARARVPELKTRDADPRADRTGLLKLAEWCSRFSPLVAAWPEREEDACEHGLTLDIAGCAHLFGGEAELAREMLRALKFLGIEARLAIAGTIGAAHALARHGPQLSLVPAGEEKAALAKLPVQALRIERDSVVTLRRLGLKTIGALFPLPRASLNARFGSLLVRRLEQAIGEISEPFSPFIPHAPYRVSAALVEPILSEDHVLTLVKKLATDLAPVLARDGKGARDLCLTLFRVDGVANTVDIRLAEATRDPEHMVKLFALKLDRLAEEFDAGLGYEAARLDVLTADAILPVQKRVDGEAADKSHILVDRLGTRLGVENVLKLKTRQSHIPERAVLTVAAAHHPDAKWDEDVLPVTRPLLILPAVEPIEVLALLPEGPPRQFRWRGVLYAVVTAEGPERIRPEWWRKNTVRVRDYYIAEDDGGRRFWLYRDGAYGEENPPHWFMHGVFA
jgi:protein ImuB